MTNSTRNNQTSILVVDDHPFSRLGVVVCLEQENYRVLEADNAQTAWELILEHRPQGAIVDIMIPKIPGDLCADHVHGINLGRQIKEEFPQTGLVFISASFSYANDVWNLVYQGKRGLAYQHKSNRKEQLLNALKKTMEGGLIIESAILEDTISLEKGLIDSLSEDEKIWVEEVCKNLDAGILTKREIEVAKLIASARTRDGIREALTISQDTVDTHITNLYLKLGINELEKTTKLRKDVILAKAYTLYQLKKKGGIQ